MSSIWVKVTRVWLGTALGQPVNRKPTWINLDHVDAMVDLEHPNTAGAQSRLTWFNGGGHEQRIDWDVAETTDDIHALARFTVPGERKP